VRYITKIVSAAPAYVPAGIHEMAQLNCLAIRMAAMGIALAVCGHAQEPIAAAAVEEGIASWYGPSFDGQRAASGEIFDSEQLTAAHRTLPFGTKVRVRRLDSEESIVVRINDRGPYVESRIIDLSYAAARRLGMTDPGLFRVALEVMENASASADASPGPDAGLARLFFAVRVGTFRNPDNARRTRDLMQEKFGASGTVTMRQTGEFWCVLLGNANTQAEAETLAAEVRKSGEAYRSAYVVHLDSRD
jgi:rare lipoprotein A